MGDYYTGNATYSFLQSKGLYAYHFSVTDHWMLIYGDSTCRPGLVVDLYKLSSYHELEYLDQTGTSIVEIVAKAFNLPYTEIYYVDGFDYVYVRNNKAPLKKYYYNSLINIFIYYKVCSNENTIKEINKYESNSFQNWQRKNLGDIVVTDLDLIKIENNQLKSIFELKRSYKDICYWEPYVADYKNFALILNAIVNGHSKADFFLCFNQYNRVTNEDYFSKIKLYRFINPTTFINKNEIKYEKIGIFSPEEIYK